MRQAVARAVHHARHRAAFGALLVDQPLMRNVLVDLALETEAATTLSLRLAHAVDEGDSAFSRLAVAVSKYWVCKRTAPVVAEALECLGRQRLRRGEWPGQALPRGPAQLHLGGVGQRQRPRRAAGSLPRAGRRRGVRG